MSYTDWSEIGMTEAEYKRNYVWPARIAFVVGILVFAAIVLAIIK